ncbi:hypothetical protein HJFPF1_04407 [Paramyrothecium foliicola]|nr:hypothetical protein HJFPF1_04407 [Paramyrothecium foliicola]
MEDLKRLGDEAMSITSLETPPSVGKRTRKPVFRYLDSDIEHIGKDDLGREFVNPYDDRCIDAVTGKFVPLEVQCTDDVLKGSGGSTWARKSMKNVGPWTLRLANWTISAWPKEKRPRDVLRSPRIIGSLLWRTAASFLPLMYLAIFFLFFTGETANGGRYNAVPYRYYGRPKKSRNIKDDRSAEGYTSALSNTCTKGSRIRRKAIANTDSEIAMQPQHASAGQERLERTLLPRKLCFLSQPPTVEIDGETGEQYLNYRATSIEKWMIENKQHCPEYLFAAFAGKHFGDDLAGMRPREAQRLHELARCATQAAGLDCYWICLNCMADRDDEGPSREALDVWRISDVIRGSRELNVLLRAPRTGETVEDPLGEWAESIWTFPELLLSPGTQITAFYFSNEKASQWERHVIPKNQFAARCLSTNDDRYQVRRLLDHYLGNLNLSDLELTTVALQCFSSRRNNSRFLSGDFSYALMGLLGRRPHISPSDSAFLAFARLSMENYNDQLFERFVCLLPEEKDQPWYNMQDAYGARLWDIEPSVQVAGIGEYRANQNDVDDAMFEQEFFHSPASKELTDTSSYTEVSMVDDAKAEASGEIIVSGHSELRNDDVVILDGCFAATVHWDSFRRLRHSRRPTARRLIAEWMVRLNCIAFKLGLYLAVVVELNRVSEVSEINPETGEKTTHRKVVGPSSPLWVGLMLLAVVVLVYSISVFFAAPWIIRQAYSGKLWEAQPWFFGFEGYMPIEDIEAKLLGSYQGRLSWSHYASSPLSHHIVKDERWVIPRDPCEHPETRQLVERARHAEPGQSRVFTIVDTHSMTATLFEANRPPEVLLVCGSEGGMQRALGCSFEWTTSTFYKETVLRLETRVLERMDRIRRVRLGIRRREKPTTRMST